MNCFDCFVDLQWCKAPEVGLPAPDVVLFMKLSPEAAALRGGYGEERYEKTEFQNKVRYSGGSSWAWYFLDHHA